MTDDKILDDLLEQLHDEDPRVRRKACDALRKYGNPAAIIELSNIYRREDEDPKVRAAAKKALSHFAARAAGSSSLLRNLGALLTVSFVILVALNVVLRMGGGGAEVIATAPPPSLVPRDILLDKLTNEVVFFALDDINALRTEWSAGAGLLPCTAQLHRVRSTPVTQLELVVYPDFGFVDDLDVALTQLDNVANAWDIACASPEKGTAEQSANALSALADVELRFFGIADAIVAAQQNPAPTLDPAVVTIEPPTTTPLPTIAPSATTAPSATPTLTVTPAPTVDPTIIRDLERAIGNTTSELNALLNNKWLIVQEGRISPFGCEGARIDPDLAPASPELAASEPDLAATIDIVNGALALARLSATSYNTNCLNSTLDPAIIAEGIANAQQALDTLDLATQVINQLKAR